MQVKETVKETESFRCPFCGFKAKTFFGLKSHVTKAHREYTHYCPICKVSCKNMTTHALNLAQRCLKHRMLYVLVTKKIKRRKEWVEWAIELVK